MLERMRLENLMYFSKSIENDVCCNLILKNKENFISMGYKLDREIHV